MSRIEKALEKAVQLRDSRTGGGPAGAAPGNEKAAGTRAFAGQPEAHISDPHIVTLNNPDSPVSEEYRKLKSMIVKLTRQGGFRNTLLVTSALGLEGKSITAINLAITLSQEYDHTVLLVDADLRKPALHSYFNITPEIGLADCIADECDLGSALIRTGIGKLSLLPAGKKVTNPAELLSSERMKEIISEMKQRYSDRYVIIDTPPILSFAETHSISSMVDGVVFVVKEGMTSLQSISDAFDILRHSKVLGMVYNDAGAEDIMDRNNSRHYFRGVAGPGGGR